MPVSLSYWRYTLPLIARDWKRRGWRALLSDFVQLKEIKWGELIGVDEHANRYYENRMAQVGRQRFVVYPHRKRYDAASITPEWHGWLHATYDEQPNEMNMRRYAWQLPPVNRLDYLSQYAYHPEFIPKGAYVRRTRIVQPEEHPLTVAATTTDPSQLKPRISVVQVNTTVTPLTEEPDPETNPYWEREKKKRLLAHPNPLETFCPTGEHTGTRTQLMNSSSTNAHAMHDDPNHLGEVAEDKQPFHDILYQPWKPIAHVNTDEPFQPVEVGARPYHAPPPGKSWIRSSSSSGST